MSLAVKMIVLVDRFQRNVLHTFDELNSEIPDGLLRDYHRYMKALSLNSWDPQMAHLNFDLDSEELNEKASEMQPFNNIEKFRVFMKLVKLRPSPNLPREKLREAYYALHENGYKVPNQKVLGEDGILWPPEVAALHQG